LHIFALTHGYLIFSVVFATFVGIESGPIPAVQGVVRWRLIDLAQWIFEENFASRSPSRRSAGSCRPWVTANSRPDRATTLKQRVRSTFF
jgi:hypothetical protein